MADFGQTWVLILAGGEGSRLRSLTTKPCGTAVPKQFCSLYGGSTLLEDAIARANAITFKKRICVIVAEQHRQWWDSQLVHLPAKNVIVQPCNRGTAVGILYPLLHILARDPDARIVLLPSDHYVREEFILCQSVHTALEQLVHKEGTPVLLGLQPEGVDPELGYLIPGEYDDKGGQSLRCFIEKPPANLASQIISQGGLWNTFIVVSSGQGLLNLFERRYQEIVMVMQSVVSALSVDPEAVCVLNDLYERLPQVDFSRDLLEASSASLRLVRVPSCGWSDLGTPKRVGETLRRLEIQERRKTHFASASAHINLALQYALFSDVAIAGPSPTGCA